ncbi:4250_t:CDS:2 [Cetraspora pellucida]|uniref:4250_t:CDS:1 n=1 Tax=Cetraspora pellucida TaxID=1433469 RepID=A0A9N9FM38_9GLOM|nr:4250_t:CDS:2 [Cetraspora pellucida]
MIISTFFIQSNTSGPPASPPVWTLAIATKNLAYMAHRPYRREIDILQGLMQRKNISIRTSRITKDDQG